MQRESEKMFPFVLETHHNTHLEERVSEPTDVATSPASAEFHRSLVCDASTAPCL